MSYHIAYEPEKQKRYPVKRRSIPITYKISIVLFVLAAILLLVNPAVRKPLQEFLLPGDAAMTGAALETMKQELRAGESVEAAVTAFCQEIIHHDKSSS